MSNRKITFAISWYLMESGVQRETKDSDFLNLVRGYQPLLPSSIFVALWWVMEADRQVYPVEVRGYTSQHWFPSGFPRGHVVIDIRT